MPRGSQTWFLPLGSGWSWQAAPTNSQCQLILHGIPGTLYAVLASPDLAATNWARLDPLVTATNFAMPFTDTNANSASTLLPAR